MGTPDKALRIIREIVELPLEAWPLGVTIMSGQSNGVQTVSLTFTEQHVTPKGNA